MHHIALIPWLDPAAIIEWAGPWALLVVCFIVFAETGLLVGFLLPGDTLLVISGLLSHPHERATASSASTSGSSSLLIGLARSSAVKSAIYIGHKGGPPSSSARNRASSASRTSSARTRSSSASAG